MKQPRFQDYTKEEWDKLTDDREELKKHRVSMDECVKGRLYKLACRNLSFGVYDGNKGFVGLRTKFRDEFLFTEIHWDEGPPFGTVEGMLDTGVDFDGKVDEYNTDLFYWLKQVEFKENKRN